MVLTVGIANTLINKPDTFIAGVYIDVIYHGANSVTQAITEWSTGRRWVRGRDKADQKLWKEWVPHATATQPQECVLPLSDGFVDGAGGGASRYWINQFGEVGFTISATALEETVSRTDVGMLPEGFHPGSAKIFCASYASDSVRSGGNSVNILTNGILRYYGSTIPAGATLFVSGTFIASN